MVNKIASSQHNAFPFPEQFATAIAFRGRILATILKEKSAHTTAHALSVVEYVEPVDELVDRIAALGDGPQVRH